MKNIAILAAAAAVMMSGSAFAATTGPIDVNGVVTAQCAVTGGSAPVSIATDLADSSGFARTDIGTSVADALNTVTRTAWCSGANNTIVLTRTALLNTTLSGTGELQNGFATGVVYDIAVKIDGAKRNDLALAVTQADGIDGTSDGPIGPGTAGTINAVSAFGPTAANAAVTFIAEGTSQSGATTAVGGNGARALFAVSNLNRLSAGSYLSTVTLTLTPGV